MTTISWKDIIESHTAYLDKNGMPEDMYVDSAESTEDDTHTEYRIYEQDNRFRAVRSGNGGRTFFNLFPNPPQLDPNGKTSNSVASITIADKDYLITITRKPQQ